MTAFEYQLVWQDAPGGAVRMYSLEGEDLRIGRSSRCDLVVIHPEVSRFHARLVWKEGTYWIEDLSSTNGTWLNGQRLEPHKPVALKPGDVIGLGPHVLLRYQPLETGVAPTRSVEALAEEERSFEAAGAGEDLEEAVEDEAEAIWGPAPWVIEAEAQDEARAASEAAAEVDEAAEAVAEAAAEAAEAADDAGEAVAEAVAWDAAPSVEAEPGLVDTPLPAEDDIPSWVQDLEVDDEGADEELVAAWSGAEVSVVEVEAVPPAELAESGAAPPAPRVTPAGPGEAEMEAELEAAAPDAERSSRWHPVLTGCVLGALIAACATSAFLWWVGTSMRWCDFFRWIPGLACP